MLPYLVKQAWSTSARLLAAAMLVSVTVAMTVGAAVAEPSDGPFLNLRSCPSLFLLGVQGTGDSSSDTPVSIDGGTLSAVFVPVVSAVGQAVADRAYVPYQASFG